jgi:hypothetical protein
VSTIKVMQWKTTLQAMGENLGKTRLRMIWWYDIYHLRAPEFMAGYLLMLDHRNVQTKCPMNKLDYNKMGPFKDYQDVGKCDFKLDLSLQIKIHPVFHVSLLEHYRILVDLKRKQNHWRLKRLKGRRAMRREGWRIRE